MGTMARTAVVAGTATVAVKATSNAMGGGQKKQAEAAQNQQIAERDAIKRTFGVGVRDLRKMIAEYEER